MHGCYHTSALISSNHDHLSFTFYGACHSACHVTLLGVACVSDIQVTRLINNGYYLDLCGALPFAGSVFWVWGTLCYQGCWQPCATAGTLLCGRAPSWPATSCGLYWPTQLAFVSPTRLSCSLGLESQGSQPWFGSYLLCSELSVCQDCAGVIWVHYGGVGTCWKCLNSSARQTKKQKGWCPRSRDHWCIELRPLRKLHNNLISWRQALVQTSMNARRHCTRGLVRDHRHVVFEIPTNMLSEIASCTSLQTTYSRTFFRGGRADLN